jgi:putative aminopeptidase FrvX
MDLTREMALDILARLGAAPATSFSEHNVASVVRAVLSETGINYQADAYGNIIARVRGVQENDRLPPLAFMAHLDHPGFEAVATQGDLLVGKALGGVPPASFEAGVPLQVILEDGRRIAASTQGRYGADEERQVLIRLAEPQPLGLPCPVVFDLTDFEQDGDYIRMRALDDLAGCASILATLAVLMEEAPPGDVYGVFTRAEEVGLVGARLLAEAGTLPKETLVVSLESSRTLPGAEIGGGPVIRVGDAGFTFSAQAESVLVKARETLQAQAGGFKVQRQLMSGGTCEASAFAIYGYQTTGIAFPLGNYHNGAPQGAIEAEYIHRDDFWGGIRLMVEAARSVSQRNNTAFRSRLAQVPDEFRRRLSETGG